MININNTSIKLKETLSEKELNEVGALEKLCIEHDNTALKLELEYKRMIAKENTKEDKGIVNEFLFYSGETLLGYIGICNFGGSVLEINGMVHPDYRRQGVFTTLFEKLKEQESVKEASKVLLLTDDKSVSGKSFISKVATSFDHAEYELYLRGEEEKKEIENSIELKKATNGDALEVAKQNAIYFGDEQKSNGLEDGEFIIDEENLRMPEDEEKMGLVTYLACLNSDVVGKINIQICEDVSGIFGLGVLPNQRKKGYGRQILIEGIKKIKEKNNSEIMLQVAAQNANALNLYISCGFVQTSTMNYYKMI